MSRSDQVDEEVEDLVGDEVGHVPLGVVAGELPRPVEVDLARAFGDAYELDIALEVSVPWQRCDGGGSASAVELEDFRAAAFIELTKCAARRRFGSGAG